MRLAQLLSLCLFSACSGALETAIAPERPDAGGDWHRDGGPDWMPDGGAPESDGGTEPDRCSAQPVLLRAEGRSLAGLAVAGGRIAVAYRSPSGAAGVLVASGSGAVLADTPIAPPAPGADLVPADLSAGGEGWFVAGMVAFPASAATAAAGVFVDLEGAPGTVATASGYSAVLAGAHTGAGGRLLALGSGDAARTVFSLSLDAQGPFAPGTSLGELALATDQWSLAWARAPEAGAACGTAARDGHSALTLFEADAARQLIARPVPVSLGTVASPEPFSCRIALAGGYRAIAWSSGSTGERIAWVGADGKLLAGPAPFLATAADASKFDVAANGTSTAVAYFDPAGGVPRVRVRVYQSPGEQPSEVRVDADLALGAFGAGRVRVVPFGHGFLVGFDAETADGRVTFARAIDCGG